MRGQLERHGIDAEAVLDGFGEEGFGIDGTGEMHVQVCALRHGPEEAVQAAGAETPGSLEGAYGAVLGRGEWQCGSMRNRALRCSERCHERQSECEMSADHATCLARK